MAKCFLGLGTNLGKKEENLKEALRLTDLLIGKVVRKSGMMASAPWGFASENSFLNMVVVVETDLSPLELLHQTQQIEKKIGRTSKSSGSYADRLIDIDVLLYEDIEVDFPELKIPHPLMKERDFVMMPLREVIDPLTDGAILSMKFFE